MDLGNPKTEKSHTRIAFKSTHWIQRIEKDHANGPEFISFQRDLQPFCRLFSRNVPAQNVANALLLSFCISYGEGSAKQRELVKKPKKKTLQRRAKSWNYWATSCIPSKLASSPLPATQMIVTWIPIQRVIGQVSGQLDHLPAPQNTLGLGRNAQNSMHPRSASTWHTRRRTSKWRRR